MNSKKQIHMKPSDEDYLKITKAHEMVQREMGFSMSFTQFVLALINVYNGTRSHHL